MGFFNPFLLYETLYVEKRPRSLLRKLDPTHFVARFCQPKVIQLTNDLHGFLAETLPNNCSKNQYGLSGIIFRKLYFK